MSSLDPSHILGRTRQRSKNNKDRANDLADTQEEIRTRLDTVEMYAKSHAVFLAILGAQALGVPTDKLVSLVLSML